MSQHPTVVLHVSDRPEDVGRSIGSASTLHKARPDAIIRIIVNGGAIVGLTLGAAPIEMPTFATVEACEVGMRSRGISVDALQPGVVTTASAIVALADAQLGGAAYVRI